MVTLQDVSSDANDKLKMTDSTANEEQVNQFGDFDPTSIAMEAEPLNAQQDLESLSRRRRVFVGNLSYRTPWQILKDHMRQAGNVLRVEVFFDNLGRSAGCGVVEFETEEMAKIAIATLNDSVLEGRPIFVREDRENASLRHASPQHKSVGRKVVVWNLPYSTRWQDLKDYFAQYGTVLRADVKRTRDGRQSKMGTVLFSTEAEATKAVEEVDGKTFNGNVIQLRLDRFTQ